VTVHKAVYIHLCLEKQRLKVIARNQEFSPQYARVIEIIETNGYQPFIDELTQ
jgi:hypothetical protein